MYGVSVKIAGTGAELCGRYSVAFSFTPSRSGIFTAQVMSTSFFSAGSGGFCANALAPHTAQQIAQTITHTSFPTLISTLPNYSFRADFLPQRKELIESQL